MRSIRDCNVAVIGGAGFLGSHMVDHLIEDRGCQVLVVDNLSAGKKEFIHHKAAFEHGDITKSESYLLKLFKTYGIQYVFNYAAAPYVPMSFKRPLYVFQINAFGALQVINAAQDAGCHGILQVSSAEIYGGTNLNPAECSGQTQATYNMCQKLDESAEVIPHSTYGASKAAIDAMVQVRWKEAQTPVIALRQFNCYGPRETHDYVIPTIISQIHRNGPNILLGNNSVRDFQYADDAVRMACELLEYGQFGEVYNLGSETGIHIYELAQVIGNVMNYEKVEITVDPSRVRPWEIWHLCSLNSKINSVVKHRHQTEFKNGLRKTIDSFLSSGGKWPFEA